jgi:hypothetical protein
LKHGRVLRAVPSNGEVEFCVDTDVLLDQHRSQTDEVVGRKKKTVNPVGNRSCDHYKPSRPFSSSSQLDSAKLNPENVVEDEEATDLTWDGLQQESPRERQGVGNVIVHLNSSY